MTDVIVTKPVKQYAASFAEALREGLELSPQKDDDIARIENDFDGWLQERTDLSKPVVLEDGSQVQRVPETTLWLISGEGHFLGRVGIRHELTETLKQHGGHIGYAVRKSERKKGYGQRLLAEGLKVANEIGLTEVLVTCNDDNLGSIKIIEKAGGEMTDKVNLLKRSVPTRRYWIKLNH